MPGLNDPNRLQVVHSLISILSKTKNEKTMLFYNTYRNYFSIAAVPPIKDFDSESTRFVQVDTKKALNYLKETYNFYSKEERESILQKEAEHHNKVKVI
jgi:hypothetical protein